MPMPGAPMQGPMPPQAGGGMPPQGPPQGGNPIVGSLQKMQMICKILENLIQQMMQSLGGGQPQSPQGPMQGPPPPTGGGVR